MIATERASYILNKLRDKDTVTLKEIAAELGVSEATVRRDFERLDKQGFVVRVRSGATRVNGAAPGNAAPLVTSEKRVKPSRSARRAASRIVSTGRKSCTAQFVDQCRDWAHQRQFSPQRPDFAFTMPQRLKVRLAQRFVTSAAVSNRSAAGRRAAASASSRVKPPARARCKSSSRTAISIVRCVFIGKKEA